MLRKYSVPRPTMAEPRLKAACSLEAVLEMHKKLNDHDDYDNQQGESTNEHGSEVL